MSAHEQFQRARVLGEWSRRARRRDCVAAEQARAGTLAAEHLQAAIEAHGVLEVLCEAFRVEFFPRAGKVFAVFGEVYVASPKGRRVRLVYAEDTVAQL